MEMRELDGHTSAHVALADVPTITCATSTVEIEASENTIGSARNAFRRLDGALLQLLEVGK